MRTIAGFLPPISACAGTPRAAAATAIARPTPVEPVEVIPFSPGWSTRCCPPRLSAGTIFRTPCGSPASWSAPVSRIAESGTVIAGFHTTVLPCTRAGAIFHAGIAVGKLNGVITRAFPPRCGHLFYAAVASVADRRSNSTGQIWPRLECLLLVL